MPKVQTLTAPSVRQQAAPLVNQSTTSSEAFGTGLGQALTDAGETLFKAQKRMQDKDDETAVKEAILIQDEQVRKRTVHDEDAYYSRNGRSAYDSYTTMQDELNQIGADVSAGLKAGRQQDIFNSLSKERLSREYDRMSQHAATGRNTWMNQQDTSAVTSAQEDGSIHWLDNDDYVIQINRSVDNLGVRNGWPPEKIELEKEKNLSTLHMSALDNILVQAPGAAQDYFDNNKDQISPSMHDDIQERIDNQQNAQWVQENAGSIRAAGGSRTERLSSARELTQDDPDRRKMLTAQIEHDLNQEKVAQQESQMGAYDEGMKAIVSGASALDFAASNPEAWNAMSGTQQASLISNSTNKPKVKNSDLAIYYEIRGFIGAGDPQKATEFLLNNIDKLSPSDTKRFMDELARPLNILEQKNAQTDTAHFNDTMEPFIGKEPLKGEKREEWNQKRNILFGVYEDGRQQWFDENPGRKIIPHESRQQILDRITIEAIQKQSGAFGIDWLARDKTIGLADLAPEQREEFIVNRNAVAENYKRIFGVAPTDAELLELFLNQPEEEVEVEIIPTQNVNINPALHPSLDPSKVTNQ